jgi:ClpX C4-type zinc finger
MQVATTRDKIACCSFCRRDHKEVGQLVAGPGVHICEACVALCSRLLTGKPTAAFTGWQALSDEEFLATLPAAEAALEVSAEKLHEHVGMLRQRGISWERIAAALGVSRQAAWERFSNEK